MSEPALPPKPDPSPWTVWRWAWAIALVLVAAMLVTLAVAINRSQPERLLARMPLADGRILIVEGVTFGTKHRMGPRSDFFDRFANWIPRPVRDYFAPRVPESKLQTERPALVMWVNAVDPAAGTNVDCQGIRVEFADRHGDLFGAEDSHWFGGAGFWRVGHVFYSFPRGEEKLTFCVTPWRTNQTQRTTLNNPQRSTAATWTGELLPQARTAGELEILLAGLEVRTNGSAKQHWITPCRYWEPRWELGQNGKPAVGWSKPEWIAEDSTGNRGQHLGIHQATLRFSATVYPEATNASAAMLVAALPAVNLSALNSDVWWNTKSTVGTNEIIVMGICPPGTRVFDDGKLTMTSSTTGLVRGGASSGWTSQSRRTSPVSVTERHNHYSDKPTIYVRASGLSESKRLAVRWRDSQGQSHTATPEPQGSHQGVHPFLLDAPLDATNLVAELVVLRPARAEFLVKTPPLLTP
ncbi:MAG: hypothetical protein AAB676_06785 [Verrucomicrobiota bacterium]